MHGFAALGELITHPVIPLACVLVLSTLFAWAGVAKVRHPYPTAVAAVNFGLARRPRKSIGVLLGAVELAIAAELLVSTNAIVVIAAGMLSVAFFALVARALIRGERFACGCFGYDAEEIGVLTLWRSGLMTVAALEIGIVGRALDPGTEVWSQAIILGAVALSLPLLISALRVLPAATLHLNDSLDWEWILQRRYPDLERPTIDPKVGSGA